MIRRCWPVDAYFYVLSKNKRVKKEGGFTHVLLHEYAVTKGKYFVTSDEDVLRMHRTDSEGEYIDVFLGPFEKEEDVRKSFRKTVGGELPKELGVFRKKGGGVCL